MRLDNITVAFLDFDGTLIKGQSQKYFIDFLYRKGFINFRKKSVILVWFVLYKLHIAKNPSWILTYSMQAFVGRPMAEIDMIMQEFITDDISPRLYKYSKDLISYLQGKGIKVVILSAAVDTIVRPVSTLLRSDDFISTTVEVINGKITGKLAGKQNYGKNKVETVQSYCAKNNMQIENTVSIADHESDFTLLKHTALGIVANPTKRIHTLAAVQNIPMIYLDINEPVQYFESNTVSK